MAESPFATEPIALPTLVGAQAVFFDRLPRPYPAKGSQRAVELWRRALPAETLELAAAHALCRADRGCSFGRVIDTDTEQTREQRCLLVLELKRWLRARHGDALVRAAWCQVCEWERERARARRPDAPTPDRTGR